MRNRADTVVEQKFRQCKWCHCYAGSKVVERQASLGQLVQRIIQVAEVVRPSRFFGSFF